MSKGYVMRGDLAPVLERSTLAAPRRKDADRKAGWKASVRKADKRPSVCAVITFALKFLNLRDIFDDLFDFFFPSLFGLKYTFSVPCVFLIHFASGFDFVRHIDFLSGCKPASFLTDV